MLKIWGRLTSINVQKVVWCAEELGIAYERIEAGRAHGVVNTPAYRAMNPNGVVPVIDDDGFVLWESNAIVRYLAARHGHGTLSPTDVQARADADRWMDWQSATLYPSVNPVFWQLIRTDPDKRNVALIESSCIEVEQKLAVLNAHLASHEFVTGKTMTMGDIPLACTVNRWTKLPIAHESHPHVARWFATLRARNAAQEIVGLALS